MEARDGSIWTPAMLGRVQALTREAFRIPGVIAPDVVSLASPNLRDLVVTETGMRPTYLMATVPETPDQVARLRERVDGDPMLRGQLVDLAGRAAMVVANFRDETASDDIARAAMALAARHRDADTHVWVVGAPVLAGVAAGAAPRLAGLLGAAVAALVLVAGPVTLGWRRTAAALLAVVATGAATIAAASALGMLVLPWTALAAVGGAVAAAALAAAAGVERRAVGGALVASACTLGAAAALAPGAERALAWGALVALPLGVGAGVLARTALDVEGDAVGEPVPRWRAALPALVAVALAAGAARLEPGFALAGYGERYLPTTLAPDVAALARLFPPPQSLALRVRGESGFVASPAVLHAFERVTTAAAVDPNVRHAMSLADLVAIVHRSFNEGRPEFAVVPDDRGLVARYLALAYSPGFRRFVDRALATAAVWVTIDGARPADLRRIADRIDGALAAEPVPDAVVERFGGDGAVTLAMAASGRRVALGGALLAALACLGAGLAAGWSAAARAAMGAVIVVAAVAGALGWSGQALDLVTVPLLAALGLAVAVSAGACGRARSDRARRLRLP